MSSELSVFMVLLLASPGLCRNALAGSPQDTARIFNYEFQGHVLILRQFYQGSPLMYKLNGRLLKHHNHGSWTSEGLVLVKAIRPRPGGLQFNCHRIEVAFDRKQVHLYESSDVEIDIEGGEHVLTLDALNQALTKIFLISDGSLLAVLPSYWRPFFSSHKRLYRRLQAQLLQGGNTPLKVENEPARIAALSHSEPQIESDSNLAGRVETASFRIKVDKTGHVTEVTILKPVGLGLDDKAVKVIRAWRFRPARWSNCVPVSTSIIMKIRYKLTGGASTGK